MSSHKVHMYTTGKVVHHYNRSVHPVKHLVSDARINQTHNHFEDESNYSSNRNVSGTGLLEERLSKLKLNPIDSGLPTRKKNISFLL